MTTAELLNLDFRSKENVIKLYKALKLIPPLSKMSDGEIKQQHLEKALHIMCNKYGMFIRIWQDPQSGGEHDIWRCQVFGADTLGGLVAVYGISLFEILIKVNIAVYAIVRKKKKREVK